MSVVARRALVFAALIAGCGALLAGRVVRSGTLAYTFLVWNLFLLLWLLFLPNAPYIVTDFIHLTAMPRVPLWFDIALLLCFAALVLSGFGIYLGRFLRWNSWDAITDPFDMATYIARHSLHPMSHERGVAVTIVYGIGLALGYVAYQLPRLRMNMQSP